MNLPPLRTGREAAQSREPVASPTSMPQMSPNVPTKVVGLDLPGLPGIARSTLSELASSGIVTASSLPEFLRKFDGRLGHLTTRERVIESLTAGGLLTRFQSTRILNGQTHGLVLGGYRVLDRIGSGTVGVVFTGEHPFMRRKVAIKVRALEENDPPEIALRFESEIRLLASLDHPHIVTAYDAGILPAVPGQPALMYLAMELVTGGDLEHYIYDKGAQSVGTVCEWMRQTAAGLAAAHAAGLVHRDVKPSNLLLTEVQRIKIIDLGLAREFASTTTVPKALLGTIGFLSPEQVSDAPTAGPPTDVYGLGAVMLWTLTGQLPYPVSKRLSETVALMASSPPRRLRDFLPDAPVELDDLIAQTLARDPGKRPTPSELVLKLGAFAAPTMPAGFAPSRGNTGPSVETERYRFAARHLEEVAQANAEAADGARAAVATALAAVTTRRPSETPGHQIRVSVFSRILATALATKPDWSSFSDARTVDDLVRASAAHDLGYVGISDELLQSSDLLPSDRHAFESHTIIGDKILAELGHEHGPSLPFLRTARSVVRHHHEKWDGTGYPDRLAGDSIPPAARIVAVADAYDSCRSSGAEHADAIMKIVQGEARAFDPEVVAAFREHEREFDNLFLAIPDARPESREE